MLVNNAGILPEATERTGNGPVDVDMFRRTFDTNVFGAVAVAQRFLPLLRRSRAGRIVNVSSTMGSLDDQLDPDSPYYGVVVPAYQGSKAALNAFTIALSKTLADTAIKVNSAVSRLAPDRISEARTIARRRRRRRPTEPRSWSRWPVSPEDGPTGSVRRSRRVRRLVTPSG